MTGRKAQLPRYEGSITVRGESASYVVSGGMIDVFWQDRSKRAELRRTSPTGLGALLVIELMNEAKREAERDLGRTRI